MKIYKDNAFDSVCADSIGYGFYGRTGGVSEGIFSSLNCGPGSGDNLDHVAVNRAKVAQHLGAKDGTISTLYQCHSGDCLSIDTHVPEGKARPQADALVTDKKGLAIGILTADCGPVLFAAKKQNGDPVIGAAHAGWGGALKGVLEDTISKMVRIGATPESIKACVGPCILSASYEVSNDFSKPFITQHEQAEHFFKAAPKAGHLMFDMAGYIAMRLALAGVKQVSLMGVDTYREESECFSFRRATHRGETEYGRQISAIVIR